MPLNDWLLKLIGQKGVKKNGVGTVEGWEITVRVLRNRQFFG